jgi:hypothetical protein
MPESLQDSAVEPPARFEIGDAQMDMVDQAALVELHAGFFRLSSRGCGAEPGIV